jgi:hypothetical protein
MSIIMILYIDNSLISCSFKTKYFYCAAFFFLKCVFLKRVTIQIELQVFNLFIPKIQERHKRSLNYTSINLAALSMAT